MTAAIATALQNAGFLNPPKGLFQTLKAVFTALAAENSELTAVMQANADIRASGRVYAI